MALRGALAALGGGASRTWAAAVLAGLAAVLVVTCMAGRSLLAGALGVDPAFSDWLVLFVALAAGLGGAELLVRLARAGRLPLDPAAGLRLPRWPLLVLTAAVAIVPAYAVTAAGAGQAACTDFDGASTTLVAQSDGGFPVRLRWSSDGGCAPIQGTITAAGVPVGGRAAVYNARFPVSGGSGTVDDRGPSRQVRVCGVAYTLRLTDARGHQVAARAGAITCPS